MVAIPAEYHDFFERDTIAHVATVMPDGTPHVTPVWIDYDPATEHVLVNTERGRQKARNAERDPKVGLSMIDPDDPYRRLSVMGVVAEATTEGARDHIDELSRWYTGGDYPGEIYTERLLLRIRPERVFGGSSGGTSQVCRDFGCKPPDRTAPRANDLQTLLAPPATGAGIDPRPRRRRSPTMTRPAPSCRRSPGPHHGGQEGPR